MKAIHNSIIFVPNYPAAVISLGKYHFESNSQLKSVTFDTSQAVISLGKYHFESNSQLNARMQSKEMAVISLGKYHFESNSQHLQTGSGRDRSCDFPRKVPF